MLSTPTHTPPGLELAVLAAMRRVTARQLARRTGLAEWRVSRILRDVARPTDEELRLLRAAVFGEPVR